MRREDIAQELKVELERIREGIAFLETGGVTFLHNNIDITADWIERQRSIADQLERLIEAYSAPED
jgi:hypothetical protein